ncbi:PREDICTED: terpenoid synthase 30 [Camelina sativa]|uniref:Terpenoid synthase 30 n=1 Tax=Camelina sativa TaxID=90675 RepID=A0ABM0YJH5_CAMSA|nr:PREDICTED: terpenoid synthase 30 [Camelina sativa]
MEATRMGFGIRNFSYLHQVPLCLKTSLTLPRPPSLSLIKPIKHDFFCVKATAKSSTSDDHETRRPLTNFSPSLWGDYFSSLPNDDSEFDEIAREIDMVMKPKVRDRLTSSHNSNKDKIRLIHLLISLGISHYFETEIEMILNQAFEDLDGLMAEEDDLETVSIMFEVFRLYQHKMSCDTFVKFKGEDGKFKESLVGDVRGMLQLYQAAHLGTLSEDIMEEAKSFARNQLESLAASTTTSSHLSSYIRNTLFRARYHNMEILVAREYISFYDQEESHDQTLLKFAKLSFNYCRLHYIQELKTLTKWWKDLDVSSQLPYLIRDRIVECYFPAMGLYYEPRYSLARIIAAKITMIVVVLDDTCDSYATFPEVKSLIDSLQRWDLEAIDELPSYSKIVVRLILETMGEIEKEMKPQGRSASVQHTINETKTLGRAYQAISKWAGASHVPTFEEYMEVGLVTAGMAYFALYSFIAMEECDEKPLYEWYNSKPKILQALCPIFRLNNDIVSYEREMSRGEVANGVNCYMKQHGVTKDVAVEELSKMARDSYKIVMEEFFTTIDMPRPVVKRCFNIARMVNVFYKDTDEFTNPDGNIKDLITSLFIHPFPV